MNCTSCGKEIIGDPIWFRDKAYCNTDCLQGASFDKAGARGLLKSAKGEAEYLGGWRSFTDGTWLMKLVKRSFNDYFERASAEYFKKKYPGQDCDIISGRLTLVAAKNAAVLGVLTGSAISIDEILALITGGEGGIGLPANLIVAAGAVMGEVVLLARIQLQLVANIAKLYNIELDPDDPEDILTILAYSAGGAAAGLLAKSEEKLGKKALEEVGKRLGATILKRTIVKYALPLASVGIGSGFNYFSTKSVGKIAQKRLKARRR